MTREEREAAISYLETYRKSDEELFKLSPQNSVAHHAAAQCLKYWDMAIEALEQQQPMVEIDLYSVIKQKYIEREVIDKIRAEIAEYGSICVTYAITDKTKTDKGIEKLVSDVLKQAKEQVLNVIDEYKAESEGEE